MLLRNARVVTLDRVTGLASVLISDGRIARIFEREPANETRTLVQHDLAGATLFPGFIDVHIHGAVGVDTMEAGVEGLLRVSKFLAAQGVTAWLPTLVPAPLAQYERAIGSISELMRLQREHWDRGRVAPTDVSKDSALTDVANVAPDESERAGRPRSQYEGEPCGARVLGVHYEGPFVNGDQCGALHRAHFRRFSDRGELDELPTVSESAAVHMMTLAPEIDGGIELISELSSRGWITSIGHTRADVELLDRACVAGARHMTHFMNAMAPLHHRAPGPIGWGLLRDDVTCDFIADGIHLDPLTLRLLCKLKSPQRLSLISDAIAAAGLGDGDYQIWGETISVANGRTQNAGGSIAGSVISMLDAVRMMRSLAIGDVEVAQMAATNPARLLRIESECGSIEEGKRADLVGLDQNSEVRFAMLGGEIIGLRP
jgi:N-acetylglucosamine-6-phosphate deacetylase